MRLWQKIFLPTLALMVLSTTLAATLLLRSSRDALWEREAANAVVLCLGLSLTGAGLLLALVWLLLRPLAALDESARRVADGRCGERLAAWVTLGYAAPQRSEFFWLLEDGTAYYPYRHRRVSAAATSAGTPKRRIPASMAR